MGMAAIMMMATLIGGASSAEAGSAYINAPVGGEVWHVGETYLIKWWGLIVDFLSTDVYLYQVSADGTHAFSRSLFHTEEVQVGEYLWTIPSSVQPGDYSIHVVILGEEYGGISDVGEKASPAFVIAPCLDTDPPNIYSRMPSYQMIKSTIDVPLLNATFSDHGSGIDMSTVRLFVDGVDVTSQASIKSFEFSYATALLDNGKHTIRLQVADMNGNMAVAEWQVKMTGSAWKK